MVNLVSGTVRGNVGGLLTAAASVSSLTVTPVAGVTQDAIAGTVLANISGGTGTTISPNDGRMILSSDGAKIIKGLVAWSAGTIATTINGGSPVNIVVGANPAYTPLVANVRCAIASVYNSNANGTETTNLTASSTAKTKPVVAVAATTGVTTIAYKLGENAASGVMINALSGSSSSTTLTYVVAYSTDSTIGSDGTWTNVTTLSYTPAGGSNGEYGRGYANVTPALVTNNWVKIVISNTGAGTASVGLALYKKTANMDVTALLGMSITATDSLSANVEAFIKSIDATRDPVVLNVAQPGWKVYDAASPGLDYVTGQVPLVSSAISAGVPIHDVIVDHGPNDEAGLKPSGTTSNATLLTNMDNLRTALNTATVADANIHWIDADYVNFQTGTPVNGVAALAQGTGPFNSAVIHPYFGPGGHGANFTASWHPGWETAANLHSVPTMMWLESDKADATTHPQGGFYPDNNYAKFACITRYLSGMPIGPTDYERRLVAVSAIGKTSAYQKQRFTDIQNNFPAAATTIGLAIRAQANAMIAALDTTMAATNLDPAGVTRPDQRTTAPSYWVDPCNLAGVTKFASLSARLSSLADRTALGTLTPGAGSVFWLEGQCNGRPVLRGNNAAGNTGGATGSDGVYAAGFLSNPAGAQTLVDGTGDMTIEWDSRSAGQSSASDYVYGNTSIFSAQCPALSFPKVIVGPAQTITSSVAAQYGVMHHYALTYNSTTHVWTLYMDGVSVGTRTYTKLASTNALLNYLGADSTRRDAADHGDFIVTLANLNTTDLALGRTYAQAKWGTP